MHETFPGGSPERDPSEGHLNQDQPNQTPEPFDKETKRYRSRRITLPGGRVIEVTYFHSDGSPDTNVFEDSHLAPDVSETQDTINNGLHICCNPDRPDCNSDLVYPVGWEEKPGDKWEIERRCPNCEWHTTDEFHQSEVELFDDVLNEGVEDLIVGLRKFARSNMEEDVERLINAINNGHVEPMDF